MATIDQQEFLRLSTTFINMHMDAMGKTLDDTLQRNAEFFGRKIEKTFKTQDKTLKKIIDEWKKSTDQTVKGWENAAHAAHDAGIELDDLTTAAEAAGIDISFLQKESKVAGKGLKEFGEKTKEAGSSLWNWTKQMAATTSLAYAANQSLDNFSDALKSGAQYNPFKAATMGMDVKSLTAMQTEFRRVGLAMTGGMEGFRNTIAEGQFSLLRYTGSMEGAAFALAGIHENARLVGISNVEQAGMASMLIQQFKNLQEQTGITAEQFNQLTKRMVEDGGVQLSLMTMNEKQRKNYMRTIHSQNMYYTSLGYTIEQAENLTKTFIKMAGESPIERLKKSAKLQALGGALGMGTEAAEAAAIRRKGRRASAEERARYDEIIATVSAKAQQMRGQGLGSEIMIDTLLQKVGLSDEMVAGNRDLIKGMGRVAGTQESAADQADKLSGNWESALKYYDIMSATLKSSEVLLGIIAAGSTFSMAKKLTKVFDKGSKSGGMKGKMAKLGGGLARGGVAGIAAYGGNMLMDQVWTPETKAGATTKGALGGAMTGAATGAMIGSFVPVIGTAIGAALGGVGGALWGLYDGMQKGDDEYQRKRLENESVIHKQNLKNTNAKYEQDRVAIMENIGFTKDQKEKALKDLNVQYQNDQAKINQDMKQTQQLALIRSKVKMKGNDGKEQLTGFIRNKTTELASKRKAYEQAKIDKEKEYQELKLQYGKLDPTEIARLEEVKKINAESLEQMKRMNEYLEKQLKVAEITKDNIGKKKPVYSEPVVDGA